MNTLTLNTTDRKGRWLSSRQVELVRCNRDWVWVIDDLDAAPGQYNNDTGTRLNGLVFGKYRYLLVPEEIAPFKPFNKLAYIKRNTKPRPAPAPKVRVRRTKPTVYHWRVVLASGRVRIIKGTDKQQVIDRATRIGRGKVPQEILSQVQRTTFQFDIPFGKNNHAKR